MKIFILLFNIFLLMTHSSKEVQIDFGTNTHVYANTQVTVEKILIVQPEDIKLQLNQDPIGEMKIKEFAKEQGSSKKYEVKDDEPRTVPLFTTFNYQEPKDQEKDILIELSEEEAINLYSFSRFYKNAIDEYPGKDDNGYCQRTYGDNSIGQLKVDACKAIRSFDFSKNSLLVTQVHATHMKMILDFVNKKDGVPPPEVGYVEGVAIYEKLENGEVCQSDTTKITSEHDCQEAATLLGLTFGKSWDGPDDFPGCYLKTPSCEHPSCGFRCSRSQKVYFNLSQFPATSDFSPKSAGICKKKNSILLGDGMSSPEDFDINFVNKIWDYNNKDVDYILKAAIYLEINSLSQLMGARIGQALMVSKDIHALEILTEMILENEFLKN